MAITTNVPSNNFEDLQRDVQDATRFTNATAPFTNRVGQSITPIPARDAQLAAKFAEATSAVAALGWFPVAGSFADGSTITARNQVLFNDADGSFYSWSGALPKVVPAASTPASTGGISANAWVNRGDAALRSGLAAPDSTVLVGGVEAGDLGKRHSVSVFINDFSNLVVGGDWMPALSAALDAGDVVNFGNKADGYSFNTNASKSIARDKTINFNGQSVTGFGNLSISGVALPSLSLTGSRLAGSDRLTFVSTAGLQAGDIINLQSSDLPQPLYATENKNETCRVLNVVSGTEVKLCRPLNFNWSSTDAGISVASWRGVDLTLNDLTYKCPQDEGETSAVYFIFAQGLSNVYINKPSFIGKDDGFDAPNNIYRIGCLLYYCENINISNGYYERMGYPIGAYACGVVLETAVGYLNHHTSADLGNWSASYVGTVHDSNSFAAWSSHMSHWYEINGRVLNNMVPPAIRSVGSKRSGYYYALDASTNSVECDAGFLDEDFEYLYETENAKQLWLDFELKVPNRTTRTVVLNGGNLAVFRGFTTDHVEIVVRQAVKRCDIGSGCSFGGNPAPRVWSAIDPGTPNVNIQTNEIRDATIVSGVYDIDVRQVAAPQRDKSLYCKGIVFRKQTGGTYTVRVHTNTFFGSNVVFGIGTIKLKANVQHQSAGYFSSVENSYNFTVISDGAGLIDFPATPSDVVGPNSGSGSPDMTLAVSGVNFVYSSASADNYIEFDVTVNIIGVSSPQFSLSYELNYQDTSA